MTAFARALAGAWAFARRPKYHFGCEGRMDLKKGWATNGANDDDDDDDGGEDGDDDELQVKALLLPSFFKVVSCCF